MCWRPLSYLSYLLYLSFDYDDKEARDVGLSCRCHTSDSQIVSSMENMLERITCLWLCVNLCIFCFAFYFAFLFFRFFLRLFVGFCCSNLSFIIVIFGAILLNSYVIEVVRFSDHLWYYWTFELLDLTCWDTSM